MENLHLDDEVANPFKEKYQILKHGTLTVPPPPLTHQFDKMNIRIFVTWPVEGVWRSH